MTREAPSPRGPSLGAILIGAVAFALLATFLFCGGVLWKLESSMPPESAHPRIRALISDDVAEVRAELDWACNAALEHARGKLPAEPGGNFARLALGRMCAYDVDRDAIKRLKKLDPGTGPLTIEEVLGSGGKPLGPMSPQGMARVYCVHARLGERKLVLEFDWHDLAMGSSFNLMSVKERKASPTPSPSPRPAKTKR